MSLKAEVSKSSQNSYLTCTSLNGRPRWREETHAAATTSANTAHATSASATKDPAPHPTANAATTDDETARPTAMAPEPRLHTRHPDSRTLSLRETKTAPILIPPLHPEALPLANPPTTRVLAKLTQHQCQTSRWRLSTTKTRKRL